MYRVPVSAYPVTKAGRTGCTGPDCDHLIIMNPLSLFFSGFRLLEISLNPGAEGLEGQ